MASKPELRERLGATRRALTPQDRAHRSTLAQAAVLSLPELTSAQTIALYRPMGNEVATDALHQALLHLRLCYPALDGEQLRFLRFDGRFVRGAHGFERPEGSTEVPLEEIDLLVLPGLGFDRAGGRLGRGAGHYDRLLAQPHRALRVGLAYDFQFLTEPVPVEPWDIPLHAICTESGVHRALRPPPD
jgi:5-formyltetrahydrofolate cyclo-ligase